MKLILLGTGDTPGTPKIGCKCATCLDALNGGKSRRTRFSILVENCGQRIIIDTSPDMRSQLIASDISLVDGVIWTHPHYDHYSGFGDFYRVQSNISVFGIPETLEYILDYLSFMSYRRNDVELFKPFEVIGLEITLFEVVHPPIKNPCGLRISDGKSTAVISGDTAFGIPAESLELMRDADIFIVDAITPEYSLKKHMNAREALELAREINAKQTIFTHMSHSFPPHNIASKKYPMGYDGMTIDL